MVALRNPFRSWAGTAARLGLSQATAHEYVTALYRHFNVRSRAQLMAHAIKRLARNDWRELSAGGRSD